MDTADPICIHVDRFLRLPSGQVTKSSTPIGFHWGILVPVFTHGPDSTDCSWEGFQVVAATAHLGSSDAGHYQCILKTGHEARANQEPALWLHCDDNRTPQPCWYLPPEFAAGVTCFWLCKCDSLDLHDMREDISHEAGATPSTVCIRPPCHAHHAQQLADLTQAMLPARSTHGLDPQVKMTLFMPSATQSVPLLERTPEDVQKKNHSVASKKRKRTE